MRSFYGYEREELSSLLTESGLPAVHAQTLFKHFYIPEQKTQTTHLPKKWSLLQDQMDFQKLEISAVHLSRYDGSVKFLLKLSDGALIESVLMPEKNRMTLCVSSQVGCKQNCSFCDTGRMGLKRNLTAHEIVLQYVTVHHWLREKHGDATPSISNVVFMGMGEPLHNAEQVIKAVRILVDPWGFNLAKRKITISTVGYLPGLIQLKESGLRVSLALSVHSVKSLLRSQLAPIQRIYPLNEVFAEMLAISSAWKQEILIQYTVFDQVNDSPEDATLLADFLEGHPVKVNLIPYNQTGKSRFRSPDPQKLSAFKDLLYARGIRAMIRYSKGQDIQAACGQLVV